MSHFSFRTCLLAGFLALSPVLALAKSYTIPDPNPVAVVTMPDDWEVTVIPKGIEADSEDEEIYVAVEVTQMSDVATTVAESIKWLQSKSVVIDASTQQQSPVTINGIPGFMIKWSGTDEDGPTNVSLTILVLSETKGLLLTYWATPSGEKDNLVALKGIIDSLKPVR